jgi:hypothetical protein
VNRRFFLLFLAPLISAMVALLSFAATEGTQGEHSPPSLVPGSLLDQNPPGRSTLDLTLEYPEDGASISGTACGTFVAGRAVAPDRRLPRFDVVIVIDTSRSTVDPSGSDINGNGVIGERRIDTMPWGFDVKNTDPGDSILAAEVAAARQIVGRLDPRAARVSVVRFAGEPPVSGRGSPRRPSGPAATTLEPLTSDFARIETVLGDVLASEPVGETHMAAGVDQAVIELMGLRGARSAPDPESEKVVFFFTDGQPTLPYGPDFEADDVRAVFQAADRAKDSGIRVHSFAIGDDALDGPLAAVEMARRTNGYFIPVRRPADLINAVKAVNIARLARLEIRNKTTGEAAYPFPATADGAWGGFIRLETGENELEITARAEDGTEATKGLTLHFEPDATAPPVPEHLVPTYNHLLEGCLAYLKEATLRLEEERNEKVRRELEMEIERERVKARARAAAQSKMLQLTIEEHEVDTGGQAK